MSDQVQGLVVQLDVNADDGKAKLRQFADEFKKQTEAVKASANAIEQNIAKPLAKAAGGAEALGASLASVGSITSALIAGGAAGAGIGGLVLFLNSSVAEFAEAEFSVTRFRAALDLSGQMTEKLETRLLKAADAIAHNSMLTREQTRDLETLGLNMGIAAGVVDRLTQAAVDMSAATGKSATSSMMALTKAIETGSLSSLRRLGLVFDETKVKAGDAEAVLGLVEGRIGGRAVAEMDTYIGSTKRLAESWKEVKENVGQFVVETMGLGPVMQEVAKWAMGLTGGTEGKGTLITPTMNNLARFAAANGPEALLGVSPARIDEAESSLRRLETALARVDEATRKEAARGLSSIWWQNPNTIELMNRIEEEISAVSALVKNTPSVEKVLLPDVIDKAREKSEELAQQWERLAKATGLTATEAKYARDALLTAAQQLVDKTSIPDSMVGPLLDHAFQKLQDDLEKRPPVKIKIKPVFEGTGRSDKGSAGGGVHLFGGMQDALLELLFGNNMGTPGGSPMKGSTFLSDLKNELTSLNAQWESGKLPLDQYVDGLQRIRDASEGMIPGIDATIGKLSAQTTIIEQTGQAFGQMAAAAISAAFSSGGAWKSALHDIAKSMATQNAAMALQNLAYAVMATTGIGAKVLRGTPAQFLEAAALFGATAAAWGGIAAITSGSGGGSAGAKDLGGTTDTATTGRNARDAAAAAQPVINNFYIEGHVLTEGDLARILSEAQNRQKTRTGY